MIAKQAELRNRFNRLTDTGKLADRRSQYQEALEKHFNEDELDTLCFEMAINYDALPASGFFGKVRELIEYAERHGKMEALRDKIMEERPFLDLD